MRCSTASVTVYLSVCSRYRMRRHAFWRVLADATTSHQFFVACTGFRWSKGSTTRWPLSSISRCEVKLHRTWLTTASWSPIPDATNFAPLTPTSSLFREQTLDLATGVSRSRVREFETVYPPHCGSLTLNFDTFNDFYWHFCFCHSFQKKHVCWSRSIIPWMKLAVVLENLYF